jgi:alpha-N-acetylglucosaminidase
VDREKLPGSTRVYAVDPFRESRPPVDTLAYLSEVGEQVMNTMLSVHPDAVSAMLSSFLCEAISKAVPKDRLKAARRSVANYG